jgi:hypothetical protein
MQLRIQGVFARISAVTPAVMTEISDGFSQYPQGSINSFFSKPFQFIQSSNHSM